jgi:NAD(P)-dependent dehydrogenase (short-subunit alcohol dehydrogenase family)
MLRQSLFVLFLATAFYFFSNLLLRREFVVHEKGIVLISGASTGIGRHAAEFLATKGFLVYAGVRKESDVLALKGLDNSNLVPVILDVSNHTSCEQVLHLVSSTTEQRNLPFVALINNAGVTRKIPIEFHDITDARRVFDTNFFGVVDLVQLSLPLLRRHVGRVVMISSITGFLGLISTIFI